MFLIDGLITLKIMGLVSSKCEIGIIIGEKGIQIFWLQVEPIPIVLPLWLVLLEALEVEVHLAFKIHLLR